MSEWFDDQIVECQNPGCVGDGTAIWSGGSQKKGYPPPSQCSKCKEANKEQEDEEIYCSNCEEEYTYSAKYIVYYRRNVDDWETPEICRWCTENPQYQMRTLHCKNAACGEEFKF